MKYSASQIRKTNEQKILTALMSQKDRKLRWNELKAQTGLSKRTLALILQDLTSNKRKILKRIVDVDSSAYPPPVFYELIDEKVLSLVDLFINQLKNYGEIPEETLTRGKNLLNEDILQSFGEAIIALSTERMEFILKLDPKIVDLASSFNAEEKKHKIKLSDNLINFFSFQSEDTPVSFDTREKLLELFATDKGFVFFIIQQLLNPYNFHIILQISHYEKKIENMIPPLPPDFFKVRPVFKKKHFETQLDDLWNWWFKGIIPHISGLVILLHMVQEIYRVAVVASLTTELYNGFIELYLPKELNLNKEIIKEKFLEWGNKHEKYY